MNSSYSTSTRGAELINTNLIKRVSEMKTREVETLASIKRKMERIRLRQARLQSKAIKESDDHYIGGYLQYCYTGGTYCTAT